MKKILLIVLFSVYSYGYTPCEAGLKNYVLSVQNYAKFLDIYLKKLKSGKKTSDDVLISEKEKINDAYDIARYVCDYDEWASNFLMESQKDLGLRH